MKKHSFMLLVFLLFITVSAQTTDPNADPNWDWRAGDVSVNKYPNTIFKMYRSTDLGTIVTQNVSAPWCQYNATDLLDDNRKEDGWVLMVRDFGEPTRPLINTPKTKSPYFALYNKYTSVLRLFILVSCQGDYESGGITVEFGSTVKTATFNNMRPKAYAADKLSIVGNYTATSLVKNIGNEMWIWGDFVLAFDPTIVPGNSDTCPRMTFQVFATTESELKIRGIMEGISGQAKYVRDFLCNDPHGKVTIGSDISRKADETISFNDKLVNAMGTADNWISFSQQVNEKYKSIPVYDKSTTIPYERVVNAYRGAVGGFKDSWICSAIPVIGVVAGILDFFTGGGKKSQQEMAPTYFGANLRLTGSITTKVNLPAGATIPIPGAKTDPHNPVMGTSAPLLYNNQAGAYTLVKTPVIQYKKYRQQVLPSGYPTNAFWDFRLKDNLDFRVNTENGLVLDSLKAYICMDVSKHVNLMYPWMDENLNYLSRQIEEKRAIEVETATKSSIMFRTVPVDARAMKYKTIQGPDGYFEAIGHILGNKRPEMYIKMIGVFHRKDDPGALPVSIIQTFIPDFEDCDYGNWPTPPEAFKVDYKKKYEFDGEDVLPSKYFYSSEQNNQITAEGKVVKNNKTYNFAGWSDGVKSLSRSITGSVSLTANYKASMITDNPILSQTKYIKDKAEVEVDNLVYESGGKCWYEINKNNEGWNLAGSGALNNDNYSKNPSFDSFGRNSTSARQRIIYQYQDGIRIEEYLNGVKTGGSDVITLYNIGSAELKPVMASGSSGLVLAVWSDQGIWYRYGQLVTSSKESVKWFTDAEMIPGTDWQSDNPAIYTVWENEQKFHLVWQQGPNSIVYRKFTAVNPPVYNSVTMSEPQILKASSMGLKSVSSPVITINENKPAEVQLGFLAKDKNNNECAVTIYNHQLYLSGRNVNEVFLNAENGSSIMVYKEKESSKAKILEIYPYYGIMKSINTGGRITMNPADKKSDMNIISSTSIGNVHLFSKSKAMSLMKAEDIRKGKEGIIAKGEAALYFRLGDIEADGNGVEFENKPDSVGARTAGDIAERTTTRAFAITEQSKLKFSVYYGTLDSAVAFSALSETDRAEFEVELIDAATKEVLGSFEKTAFTKTNLSFFEKINYIVNTEGIGTRKVRLRLKAKANFSDAVNISNIFETEGMQKDEEGVTKQAGLRADAVVKEYTLEQNYPNPFNPTTTIRYAIPNDGQVKLTVYNLLGQEVTTLVNEYKLKGKYEAKLDAANLASGMYIYKIESGSFSDSKRMMLVK